MSATRAYPAGFETAPGETPSHRLNRDVLFLQEEGVARLLDFNRGHFFGLDAVGAALVADVLQQGPEAAVARISREYAVPADQVRRDLAGYLDQLERRGLLVPTAGERCGGSLAVTDRLASGVWLLDWVLLSRFRAIRWAIVARLGRRPQAGSYPLGVPGPGQVGRLLTLAWLSLRLFGWSGTLALWRRWHPPAATSPATERREQIEAVNQVIRQVAAAKLLFPVACKERALVGYQLLRGWLHLPASLVVGIQRHPFQAHAWVECDGICVTDAAAHCENFTPVARFL